jgi:D-beta-D-heptose 7-phosphate kinase/D-beta-D-heptose 1-phosphate adenosyltransferase
MAIQQHKKLKILLIGDNCIDEYHYGTVDRISPEAPVPIFTFSHKKTLPGMAGNVKENLEALGCFVVSIFDDQVSAKTRLIDQRSRQQIVRIDTDVQSQALQYQDILYAIESVDAIVISDYNKGCVSYELVEQLRKAYAGPIFIDTKKTDLNRFEGCFVKINAVEYSMAKTFPQDLIVTLGNLGARYRGVVYPAAEIDVVDVTGAGDTFLSALAYCYVDTQDIKQAIAFAIRASAITVQHSGVYAPSMKEIT